jgi:tRNA threonylcarbamoyladenosine biosynthesis protein TsaB
VNILTIRTDKPEAELGFFDDERQIDYELWQADRELSLTILSKITDLLQRNGKEISSIGAIVTYKGPGSFTGLRIGLSVANTLAYGLRIQVVGSDQVAWIQDGIERIKRGENEKIVLPEYGQAPNITRPTK